MPYEVELSTRAADRLRNLPAEIRGRVVDHLYRLAAEPVRLSRPAPTPPYPPGFQAYEFTVMGDSVVHRFAVLFKYAQDERFLWVHGIGHVEDDRDA